MLAFMRRRAMLTAAMFTYLAFAGVAVWMARNPTLALAKEEDAPLAPDLTGGQGWINIDHPVHITDLRGQVVILDFWTYG